MRPVTLDGGGVHLLSNIVTDQSGPCTKILFSASVLRGETSSLLKDNPGHHVLLVPRNSRRVRYSVYLSARIKLRDSNCK
jgi:hypothetical protein